MTLKIDIHNIKLTRNLAGGVSSGTTPKHLYNVPAPSFEF